MHGRKRHFTNKDYCEGYDATKHALEGATKAMAWELAEHDIRVNTVGPTFIYTPLTAPMFEDQEFRDFVESHIANGKLGKVEDVMGAVVYLASDASAYMTGSVIVVDGGQSSII